MRPTLYLIGTLALGLLLAGLGAEAAAESTDPRFVYNLSDFSGTVPLNDATLHIDRETDEVYVLERNRVRIFNPSGMEVYRFGESRDLGRIYGLAAESSGDIILLIHRFEGGQSSDWYLLRCDYRGEPLGPIEISGLPARLASFTPNQMAFRSGKIYLVSTGGLEVAVLDPSGRFERAYDLADRLGIEDVSTTQIAGFSVDAEGSILVTIPVLFRVFIVPTAGPVQQFGTPGSSPGHFGIIEGIVRTDDGGLLVADRLRNVVMVFNEDFTFVREFGRSKGLDGLLRPTSLALGNDGRLYISQRWADRGVALFALPAAGTSSTSEEPQNTQTLGSGEPASLTNNLVGISTSSGGTQTP